MVSSVKLAELWQRLGWRVVVVCMSKTSGIERVSDTLTIHRRRDLFLPDPWNYGIAPGFSGYVRRIEKELRPDLIIINKLLFWSSLATIRLRLAGRRVLLLTDAFVGITWHPRDWFPRIIMSAGAWTVGWLVMLAASHVVTFHPQPRRILRILGIAKKTEVIPTGIDVTGHLSKSRLSGPATSDQRQVTVTYVGRLESVKGVEDFLAAILPLKERYPALHVQVVGWYKDGHPLVSQYQRQVTFTGLRHDIPEVLAETAIFVLPSYSEGLSNALMEAMASGCACIASDVGGNRFLIQNGVSGLLFSAGDREALRAHIRRLLDDPAKRRSLGENARQRIAGVFSWDVVGKQYEELFQRFSA